LLFLISFPAFLSVALWGDDLFAWFLGENYRIAGVYGRYLTPYLFLNFIVSPISQIPLIVNKQKQAFLLSLCGHSFYLLAVIIGGIYHDILLGFTFLSVFLSIYYIFLILWLIKISCIKKIDLQRKRCY